MLVNHVLTQNGLEALSGTDTIAEVSFEELSETVMLMPRPGPLLATGHPECLTRRWEDRREMHRAIHTPYLGRLRADLCCKVDKSYNLQIAHLRNGYVFTRDDIPCQSALVCEIAQLAGYLGAGSDQCI